jgi:hypothetical protein
MGWQQKLTAFCNLVRHNVDKIVEAFYPEKKSKYIK